MNYLLILVLGIITGMIVGDIIMKKIKISLSTRFNIILISTIVFPICLIILDICDIPTKIGIFEYFDINK